ncbi:uncharacterized protein LY79DRAFT_675199 [Colletotrichum navitas]|uniref:PD-(D/E)XK nuclease-like domain-containing protein n=1 Tax=Colletotrichum navitas TaxID=681940 RepID=A0AAD8PK08_9PEZI|nr:uncharacterized protein LY79DRAFT_675199 [Colletotrichum navitas]KAK1564212.1 hypothetical protein LY79DRAFT_675199 [Colletotrichum navitas]
MASPGKRPLPAEYTNDSVDPQRHGGTQPDDRTPKAPRSYASFAASDDWGATPSLPSRASSLSSVTRKSSPTKQFRHAELWEDGFTVRKINQAHNKPADKIQPLPKSLRDLKARLNQVSLGVHLLPERCRDEFSHLSYPAEDASIPPSAYMPQEAEAVQQWRTPPLSLINKTISKATDCDVRRKDEYAWNADVHHGLFAFVFDDEGLVDAETCPTADILSRFKPKGAPSKSIDFCLVVRPENLAEEAEEREKMELLCRYRFGNSINHSVQGNLCCCPIAVSIETKRPGGQWDDALLQMGTWQAAQWRSYTQHGLPPCPALEFLPGIIVHGHRWRFVATVRQGSKAVLLTEIDIGTTSTEFGVIQIVIALEILKRWSAEVFWPAFKSDVVHHGLSVVAE